MLKKVFLAGLAALALNSCEKPTEPAAKFTEEDKLSRPDPTEWVFVSSSASAVAPSGASDDAMMAGGNDMMAGGEEETTEAPSPEGKFNIIRIDPAAWKAFQTTGEFPEGTVFAMAFYSMNDREMNADRYWADQPLGMEVAVKDSNRFEDGWAYFRFEGAAAEAEAFPKERCFQCHQENGAWDNVFTQLYAGFSKEN